jgi:hypothetical protein
MAFALIASTSKGGSTNQTVTTDPVNTTGANLIVLNIGFYDGSTPTIAPTDSKGNTWVPLTVRVNPTFLVGDQLFYCVAPIVGSGHTFTQEDLVDAAYPSMQALAFSGAHASPFDQQTGATAGVQSTISPGSLTPSEDNCLVIAGVGHEINTAGAVSINGGFTALAQPYVGGTSEGAGIAWLIQTTAALAAPTWDFTNNAAGSAASLATFKPSAAVVETMGYLRANKLRPRIFAPGLGR